MIGKDGVEIQAFLEAGLPIVEAIMPYTRPPKAEQLSFFGEQLKDESAMMPVHLLVEGIKHSESLRRCINALFTLKSFTT